MAREKRSAERHSQPTHASSAATSGCEPAAVRRNKPFSLALEGRGEDGDPQLALLRYSVSCDFLRRVDRAHFDCGNADVHRPVTEAHEPVGAEICACRQW